MLLSVGARFAAASAIGSKRRGGSRIATVFKFSRSTSFPSFPSPTCDQPRRRKIMNSMPSAAKEKAMTLPLRDLEDKSRMFGPWTISKDEIFAESAMSFAFVNLKPVVAGHVLVAPKRVCKRFTQLSMEEVADLWQLAKVRRNSKEDSVDRSRRIPSPTSALVGKRH